MSRHLVFGEDFYDAQAIATLIRALGAGCPVQPRRRPFSMSRSAALPKRRARATEVRRLVAAESARSKVNCVFVHSDADAVSPADAEVAADMEAEYAAAGVEVHAVVPGWETESLWFLFPTAVAGVNSRWTPLPSRAGDVGLLAQPKERLKRDLVRGRRGTPTYQESDAPRIAEQVLQQNLINVPSGSSDALTRLQTAVHACRP